MRYGKSVGKRFSKVKSNISGGGKVLCSLFGEKFKRWFHRDIIMALTSLGESQWRSLKRSRKRGRPFSERGFFGPVAKLSNKNYNSRSMLTGNVIKSTSLSLHAGNVISLNAFFAI